MTPDNTFLNEAAAGAFLKPYGNQQHCLRWRIGNFHCWMIRKPSPHDFETDTGFPVQDGFSDCIQTAFLMPYEETCRHTGRKFTHHRYTAHKVFNRGRAEYAFARWVGHGNYDPEEVRIEG